MSSVMKYDKAEWMVKRLRSDPQAVGAGIAREAANIIEGLLAAARIEHEGWRPIETAPKDGTHILVYSPDRCGNCSTKGTGVGSAWWDEGDWQNGRLEDGRLVGFVHIPTHWLPLPPPPSEPTK